MNSFTENNDQVPEMQRNLELLQELPFFSSFPIQALKLLALTAERVLFKEDEIIFEAGDDHGRAYLLFSGQLTLLIQDDKEELVRHYHEGDFTGTLSLLSPLPALFTLKAAGQTKVLSIDREHFAKIIEQFPEVARLTLIALAKEIHQWERKNLNKAESCCLTLAGVSNI